MLSGIVPSFQYNGEKMCVREKRLKKEREEEKSENVWILLNDRLFFLSLSSLHPHPFLTIFYRPRQLNSGLCLIIRSDGLREFFVHLTHGQPWEEGVELMLKSAWGERVWTSPAAGCELK